jgi:hypothetical protein
MTDTADFDRVFALLAIIADAPGCKARLAELQKSIEKATAAQTKVDNDRASHERTTAADKASTAEREKMLRDRAVAVAIKERNPWPSKSVTSLRVRRRSPMRGLRGLAPIRTCRPAPSPPAA